MDSTHPRIRTSSSTPPSSQLPTSLPPLPQSSSAQLQQRQSYHYSTTQLQSTRPSVDDQFNSQPCQSQKAPQTLFSIQESTMVSNFAQDTALPLHWQSRTFDSRLTRNTTLSLHSTRPLTGGPYNPEAPHASQLQRYPLSPGTPPSSWPETPQGIMNFLGISDPAITSALRHFQSVITSPDYALNASRECLNTSARIRRQSAWRQLESSATTRRRPYSIWAPIENEFINCHDHVQ